MARVKYYDNVRKIWVYADSSPMTPVDPTLKKPGWAADAKVTGEEIPKNKVIRSNEPPEDTSLLWVDMNDSENPKNTILDPTLTLEGQPADAKATGDRTSWNGENTKPVQHIDGTTEEIEATPISDGQVLFDNDNGTIWKDVGNTRKKFGINNEVSIQKSVDPVPDGTSVLIFTDQPDPVEDLGIKDAAPGDFLIVDEVVNGVPTAYRKAVDSDFENFSPKYNNAMTHNLPRGKFLGTNVTVEQYEAISSGNFNDIYVGDYWNINDREYVVSGINYYKNCGDASMTQNHVVIVPRKVLYYAQMHNTVSGGYEEGPEANTTEGGYALSDMRTKNLDQAREIINQAFPGHVLTHRLYLCNAVSGGKPSNGAWFDSDIDLMNENMVYGCPVWQNMTANGGWLMKYRVEKNQLPIFSYNFEFMNTRESYWLRDVCSATYFACAPNYGDAIACTASYTGGVRPAFAVG